MVAFTAFLQSSISPASCIHDPRQSVYNKLAISGFTYTLDRYRLDTELRPNFTSEFLSGILARDIVDSDIGAFAREILDDESS